MLGWICLDRNRTKLLSLDCYFINVVLLISTSRNISYILIEHTIKKNQNVSAGGRPYLFLTAFEFFRLEGQGGAKNW